MSFEAVKDVATLEELYGVPGQASQVKVAHSLTAEYRALIEASPFFALATAGPEGLDCSPRGELGGAFIIHDDKTIIIPDRRGNNRMDSLRNIVRNPEIAMLFLIPGSLTTIRLNGTAIVTTDEELLKSMERDGKLPRSAVVVSLREIYTQCGRAVLRAGLWDPETYVDPAAIPSTGDVLKAQTQGAFEGKAYDEEWAGRAEKTMW
ncbi:pyridoxamine 5'-phosphate oxidase family protein [Ahrensia kielensis]|uniref:pyridoxamine 5'-phosphate oxidase family protein n=1 Tax=Ahrensia kielensis TaxID=76980 RepID=UPI00035E8D16|nr:pyridoxamine 5'-phosphate oxidase family protein [Ahrensia kielensis]